MASLECTYPKGQPRQDDDELVPYTIDVSEWSDSVSSPSVVEIIDESDGSDVISTVMPSNAPVAAWPNITLSHLRNTTAGRNYRIEVQFTGDNMAVFRCHLTVRGR